MVMGRDGIAGMGLNVLGRQYTDPVRHPVGPAASGADPNAALIAAINALSARLDTWVPGRGGPGVSGAGVPGAGQVVQFANVDLTAAHTLLEVTVAADYDYCVAYVDGPSEGVYVRQRDHSAEAIDVSRYQGFPLLPGTNKIFVTNDVKTGRTTLVLGFSYGEPLRLGMEWANVSILRWGVAREPAWVSGTVTDNPGAGTALVSKTVTAGKTGRVFGLSITADEANTFDLYADAVKKAHFAMAAAGNIYVVLPAPMVDSLAVGTVVAIKNVSAAGGAGKYYQAQLLYDEA